MRSVRAWKFSSARRYTRFMPVQIGAKPHAFSDPTGLLSDCHRRIEMFLGSLIAVSQKMDQTLDEQTRSALENALRYFREAAPKHTADEEGSLFPRLRKRQDREVASALDRLEELEGEHRWAEKRHAEVENLGQTYLSRGSLSAEELQRFREAVSELASMYQRHIALEDEVLFPLAARVLSAEEKSQIATEMADRRQTESR